MQIKNRKLKTNNKGITLIALVITIIVLLILASVAIATLTGDNGILTKAVTAKDKTTEAEAREAVQLEAIGSIDNTGKFNYEDFKTNVKKNLGLTDSNIKDNGNGTCTVTYKGYDVTVDKTTGEVTTIVKAGEIPPTPPAGDYNTGTTVAEAIEQDKPFENNTPITDEFGNKITVPAGFKIIKDNPADPTPSVKDGIVIQDATYEGTIGSEFVWIPVGEIKKSETETVTISLGRYEFNETGEKSDYSGGATEDTQANHNSDYKNAIATDIENFKLKASAEGSGGYYIGRYEARVDNYDASAITTSNSEYKVNWTGYKAQSGKELKLVIKPNNQVWNYVTQNKASELSKNMYTDKTFTSDLMNSYAWDTATLFLQTFDDRTLEGKKVYSRQNSLNSSLANQGTNKLEVSKQDKICNVWDMASNCYEWTTETLYGWVLEEREHYFPCVLRGSNYNLGGGSYSYKSYYTADRNPDFTTSAYSTTTFRPLLYL